LLSKKDLTPVVALIAKVGLARIAAACGVALKLHAEKKPHFDREVALV
jgi:hypothetical protein